MGERAGKQERDLTASGDRREPEHLLEGALTAVNGDRSAVVPPEPISSRPWSIALCRKFCEELIADAMVEAGETAPPGPAPPVDWSQVWVSGQVLPVEKAAGRAVLESQRIAREILEQSTQQGSGTNFSAGRVEAPLTAIDAAPVAVAGQPASAVEVDVPIAALGAPTATPPVPAQAPVADGQHAGFDVDAAGRHYQRLRTVFVAFGWVRNIGLVLLLFAAWQLWGTSIEHAHAQQALGQQFRSHVHQTPQRAGTPLVSANASVPEPPEGSVVGRLQIPAIGVDQYVVEGTTEVDLAKGPGHYVGTSQPGQAGNVAIAGHRTTYGAPFNHLDQLTVNDRIILTTDAGQVLTYLVSQAPIAISPRDVAILNTGRDNRLTLTTCNPKFSASQRLVVVGLLSAPQTAVPTGVTPKFVHVVADATGWNMGYLPVALLVLALLVLLGLANQRAKRVYGRVGRWLVLTPIWAGGLYFLFVLLTKLLPANL